LAEAARDGSIFDTSVLVDGGLSCRQYMLKTSKGSLEGCMSDNRLVCERDMDAHRDRGADRIVGGVERRPGGKGRTKGRGDSGEEVCLIWVSEMNGWIAVKCRG
jgi:hypothetical protein